MVDVFAINVSTIAEEAAKIVPREEFRVFGHDIIPLVQEKNMERKGCSFQGLKNACRKIFFSFSTSANVRVRADILEIKDIPNCASSKVLAQIPPNNLRQVIGKLSYALFILAFYHYSANFLRSRITQKHAPSFA